VDDKPIRVVVADDSMVCREMIKQILESSEDIGVVGTATDGAEAVRLVKELKPSIVTLDMHMPQMGGLEATEQIMAYTPTPILIVSTSVNEQGTSSAFEALKAGALDVLKKPEPQIWSDLAVVGDDLIRKVRMLSRLRVVTHLKGRRPGERPHSDRPAVRQRKPGAKYRILALGSSTGGPLALLRILSKLPADFPIGIVVAQHIADGFIQGLVEWLDAECELKVRVGGQGDAVRAGEVVVAPTGHHMTVEAGRVVLLKPRPTDVYKPSVDMLFSSVAKSYGAEAIGVILTGMGADGAGGLRLLSDAGALTLAQDELTSTVFGMPKAAIEMNAAGTVLPIDQIAEEVMRLVSDEQDYGSPNLTTQTT